MFCYLNSDEFKNNLLSMASGSAQLNFGPMQLNEISLELPNDQDLLSFNRLAGPLLSKALLLLDEIKTLRETKKFLLSRYF
jgi:restriction endonuclease S subunit